MKIEEAYPGNENNLIDAGKTLRDRKAKRTKRFKKFRLLDSTRTENGDRLQTEPRSSENPNLIKTWKFTKNQITSLPSPLVDSKEDRN